MTSRDKKIGMLILIVLMAFLIIIILTIPTEYHTPRIIFSFLLGIDVAVLIQQVIG